MVRLQAWTCICNVDESLHIFPFPFLSRMYVKLSVVVSDLTILFCLFCISLLAHVMVIVKVELWCFYIVFVVRVVLIL